MLHRRQLLVTAAGAGVFASAACAKESAPPVKNSALSSPFYAEANVAEAPFGGKVSEAIVNYNRASPYVANSGSLKDDGLEEAQRLGFKLIIDLRMPHENGVRDEARRAEAMGLNLLNIAFERDEGAWSQVEQFAAILEDASQFPILVHCASSNRSGAIWALYRASTGVPPIVAIEEGRASGLKSRENDVRKLLNLPLTSG